MENCTKVIFAKRACNAIVSDATDQGSIETGGVLLGIRIGSIWYVLETTDPGPYPMFKPASIEYETQYANHLTKVLSRQYATGLEVLGLWYSNPGHMDTFPSKNHYINPKIQSVNSGGAIVGRINIEPELHLTMYQVSISLEYTKVNFEVDDHQIPERLFQFKHGEEIRLINLIQHCKPYVSWPTAPIFDGTNRTSKVMGSEKYLNYPIEDDT